MSQALPEVLGILLAGAALVFVFSPLFRSARGTTSADSGRRAELEAERDAAYSEARDLDFELRMGRLASDEHRDLRRAAERRAATALRAIEEPAGAVPAVAAAEMEAEAERLVRQLRASWAAEGRRHCPSCGAAAGAAIYCATCGARLPGSGETV